MRRRSPAFRFVALAGAVWLQAALAGAGLHDPACAHHAPGAAGEGHRHGSHAAGPTPRGGQGAGAPLVAHAGHDPHSGHAAHAGHAAHGGARTPGAAAVPTRPSGEAPGPSGDKPAPPEDDCRCQGVCVPGALTGALTLASGVPTAPAVPAGRAPRVPDAGHAPQPRQPHHLPPATGPPLRA